MDQAIDLIDVYPRLQVVPKLTKKVIGHGSGGELQQGCRCAQVVELEMQADSTQLICRRRHVWGCTRLTVSWGAQPTLAGTRARVSHTTNHQTGHQTGFSWDVAERLHELLCFWSGAAPMKGIGGVFLAVVDQSGTTASRAKGMEFSQRGCKGSRPELEMNEIQMEDLYDYHYFNFINIQFG